MRGPKKQKGMDYNADIPFEKQPARGFYDTSEESTRSYQAPVGKTITALNGGKKARDEAMNEGGKEKKRKGGDGGGEKDPFKDSGKEDQIRKLREAEQISKRRKLDLPAAQVGESELEEIVKMGRAGQISREMVSGDGNQSTEGLLGEYEALERAKHARTPMVAPEGEFCTKFERGMIECMRYDKRLFFSFHSFSDNYFYSYLLVFSHVFPSIDDAIMLEARNLRNRTEAQTPLLGDANAPIHQGTGNAGALPRGGGGGIVQTPNPLLTPARSGRMGDPGATPMSVRGFGGASNISSATPRSEVGGTGIGQTPMRTPFRDNLGLNEETSTIGDTPASAMTSSTRSEKYLRANARRELQMGLKGLPAPKNDFELVMDEDEEKTTGQDVLEDEIHFGVPLSEEDAAERDARIERLKEERRLKELARRSQAVQLGLPRPANVDEKALIDALRSIPLGSDSSIDAKAQRLIDEEMVRLLKHDSIVHPIAGSKAPGGSRSDLATLPDEYVEEAKNLIHVELATLLGFPGANPSTVKRLTISKLLEENDGGNLEAFEKVLSLQRENLAWHPDSRVWVSKDQLSKKDFIRGKQCQLEDLRESMSLKSLQATKEEKKLTKILGGYQARGSSLGNGLKQNFNDLIQSNFDHQVFERLFLGEQMAIPERIESLDKEVKGLNRIFDEAQNRWKEFEERQRELEEECEELQSEIDMREAEKLNDEALEDQQDVEVNGNGKEGQDEDQDDDDEVGPPPP